MNWKEHHFPILGSDILVIEAGNPNGQPFIMTDGWLGRWTAFEKLIPYLEDDNHIFIVASPGFGESEKLKKEHNIDRNAEVLLEVIYELRKQGRLREEKVILLGLSFGASVVTRFASRFPDLVSHLIVQGLPMFRQEESGWVDIPLSLMRLGSHVVMRAPVYELMDFVLRRRLIIKAIFKLHPELRKLTLEDRDLKLQQLEISSGRAVIESARSVVAQDIREDLRAITIPVLVVDGEMTLSLPQPIAWVLDNIIFPPLNTAKIVHELVPNSRLVIIPDGSHVVSTQKPREFSEAILDFLKDH